MVKALAAFSLSSLVGLMTALAAWVVALVIVGNDDIYIMRGRVFEWGTVISAITAVFALGIIILLYRSVEPVLTALATAAGAVMLYQVQDLPFGRSNSLNYAGGQYWTIVASMIVTFSLLVLGLRGKRSDR